MFAMVADPLRLSPAWLPPPTDLALPDDQVHVWRASLDLSAARTQRLAQFLSADERARAERFRFERDRDRFIVARGVLRAILGRYLRAEPAQLRFEYNSHGKPALALTSIQACPCFNVSHAGDLALYVFARGRAVGVDIERLRADFECDDIAAQFFSSQERVVLRSLPAGIKPEAFFNCWTRKEAYVKARGEGLSLPLDEFDVSLVPGEPARLLCTRNEPPAAARWSLKALYPGPGYAAALAVEGHDWRLACWQWNEL